MKIYKKDGGTHHRLSPEDLERELEKESKNKIIDLSKIVQIEEMPLLENFHRIWIDVFGESSSMLEKI